MIFYFRLGERGKMQEEIVFFLFLWCLVHHDKGISFKNRARAAFSQLTKWFNLNPKSREDLDEELAVDIVNNVLSEPLTLDYLKTKLQEIFKQDDFNSLFREYKGRVLLRRIEVNNPHIVFPPKTHLVLKEQDIDCLFNVLFLVLKHTVQEPSQEQSFTSFCTPVKLTDQHIRDARALQSKLNQHKKWAKDLNKKAEQIAEREKQIAEREKQIVEKEKQIVERESRFQKLFGKVIDLISVQRDNDELQRKNANLEEQVIANKTDGSTLLEQYQEENSELKKQVETLKGIAEEKVNCLICHSGSGGVGVTHCGHRFHKECLEQWVQRRNECPFCRESQVMSGFIPVVY